MLPDIRESFTFGRLRPFFVLVRATCTPRRVGSIDGIILTVKNQSIRRRKTCPSATLSTTNPTRTDLGLGLRGERRATSRLNQGTALYQDKFFVFIVSYCGPTRKHPNTQNLLRTLSKYMAVAAGRACTSTAVRLFDVIWINICDICLFNYESMLHFINFNVFHSVKVRATSLEVPRQCPLLVLVDVAWKHGKETWRWPLLCTRKRIWAYVVFGWILIWILCGLH